MVAITTHLHIVHLCHKVSSGEAVPSRVVRAGGKETEERSRGYIWAGPGGPSGGVESRLCTGTTLVHLSWQSRGPEIADEVKFWPTASNTQFFLEGE